MSRATILLMLALGIPGTTAFMVKLSSTSRADEAAEEVHVLSDGHANNNGWVPAGNSSDPASPVAGATAAEGFLPPATSSQESSPASQENHATQPEPATVDSELVPTVESATEVVDEPEAQETLPPEQAATLQPSTPIVVAQQPAPIELPAPPQVDPLPQVAAPARRPVSRSAVVVQTELPSEINLNEVMTCQVSVRNESQNPVYGVALEVVLPAEVELIGSQPELTTGENGRLLIQLGQLDPAQQRQVLLQVKPLAAGNLAIDANATFTAAARTEIAVRQPELALAVTLPDELIADQPADIPLTISNIGDGVARDVMIRVNLPAGLATLAGAEELTIGTVRPGESHQLQLRLTPMKSEQLPIEFIASAGELSAVAAGSIGIISPELEIAMAGPELCYLNGEAIYAIVVSNPGSADANQVALTIQVPQGLSIEALDRPAGYDTNQGALVWQLDSLAAGEREVLRVMTNAQQEGAQQIDVQAIAAGGLTAQQQLATEVLTRADLQLHVSHAGVPLPVGGESEVTIHIENRGSQRAEAIDVIALLPATIRPVETEETTFDGNAIHFDSIDVAPGETCELVLRVVGTTNGDQVVRVVLSADCLSRELVDDENLFFFQSGPSAAFRDEVTTER